ncbi:hypothetical protein C8R48DRAFT_679234 [Suillus tomentosus]|nr:hypothetical protein C8R48DRAFT_679234 [Suillus tomentosus]
MAPPRWTSAEQLLWLQNEMPAYLQMQKEKKLPRFFETLFPRWFIDFPEETELNGSLPCDENVSADKLGKDIVELGKDIVELINETAQPDSTTNPPISAEQEGSESNSPPMQAGELRKKLREWFRNNSKGKTTPGGSSTGKALSALLGQRARGTRDLKEVEVYSKLHYESKVKPLVCDALKKNLVQPTQRLSAVRQHTTDCFADESEEVKKEIREETVRLNAARRLGSVVGENLRTKEEVYHAIQELPMILGQVFEELSALTGGWHYSVVMGGADPLCEGDIMTLSYHHGKTADGLSFKASTPNFHEQYLLPFERYLGRIHGASSKCTLAPSSTPISPCLLPTDLISLDEPLVNAHLDEPLVVDAHLDKPLVVDAHLDEPLVVDTHLDEPLVDAHLDEPLVDAHLDLAVSNSYNLDFSGLAGVNGLDEWSMHAGSDTPTDTPITAWRKSTLFHEGPHISPTFNRTQRPAASTAEAIPPFLYPLSSFHTTLLPQPSSFSVEQMNTISALEVNTLSTSMVSIDRQSLPASHQPTPPDIGGVLADEYPQPDLEARTVSSLPAVSASSSRRSGRPTRPSTRADEANKIGDQQGTKPTTKRKQTEVRYGAEGSTKKSRK